MFATDLTGERMLHFPTLRKATSPPKVTAEMTGLVAKLKDNFASRLEDLSLPTEAMQLTKDPFAAIAEETLSIKAKEVVSSIDEGQFLLELVDMQSSLTMPQELRTNGPAKFWSQINAHQFPNLKNVAVTVLSMFGSTYICESSFSHMNAIKTNLRSSLTESFLHYCLRIALSSYEPNIPFLVQNKKCHLSQ
uniref:HAT C-terminal dimerisation domain-containing protein n=1 Tax=Nothobranchius korthausae TaxID=1143690 RepID=A0A1A8GM58_9TELE